MESTASNLSNTSETPNPAKFSPPRKRPRGAFKGIGFILAIWVQRMHRAGLLPTLRSLSALLAISDAVDADGRWCFFLLENLAGRSGGTLSVSSLKRAIDDLAAAGVVRKLTRSETLGFFAEDINRGRSVYQLPCVLELLVPAEDYPELVLAEINACRAELGEEPLNAHNRPPLTRRWTRAHTEPTPSSDRPTDCSPGYSSEDEAPGSVRGSASTGEKNRQKLRSGLFGIIDRIPDAFLSDPETDRERLGRAVENLLRQGLSAGTLRTLFSGIERLGRPFPALMHRLRSPRAARAFLDGSLGRGIHAPGTLVPSWPVPVGDDAFAQPEQFPLDSQGRANRTCPEHDATRNAPGSTCVICGRRCRSVPGELIHEPTRKTPDVSEPSGHPDPAEVQKPVRGVSDPDVPREGLDPELLERMAASLDVAGRRRTVVRAAA
ncbi:hypothetical protein [Nocardiopsis oceani]